MNGAESTRQPRVGLALGSGSARGLSHIGVIQELASIGIAPSIVCGTSIGALVGGAYACGRIDQLAEWFTRMSTTDVFRYLDIRPLSRGGVGRASRLIESLRERFGSPLIESLPITFAAVATDLATGRELWIQHGDMWDGVRGSIAIPGLLSPARIEGRWVVDGGLVNPVPVSVCRALGAELIIAINLNSDLGGRQQNRLSRPGPREQRSTPERDSTGLFDRLATGLREKAPQQIVQWLDSDQQKSPEDDTPGIFNVVANAINIMQDRITRSRLSGEPADIVISPRLSHIGLLEFEAAAEAIEAGRAEVRLYGAMISEMIAAATGR
jgi:NTE family protein